MAIRAKAAAGALPVAVPMRSLPRRRPRNVDATLLGLRVLRGAGPPRVSQLLVQSLVLLTQPVSLVTPIPAPTAAATFTTTRSTAAAPGPPPVIVLRPAPTSHRCPVAGWRTPPAAVMGSEQLTALCHSDNGTRPLPGPTCSTVPRWLRRGVDAGSGPTSWTRAKRGAEAETARGAPTPSGKARQCPTEPSRTACRSQLR